MIVGYQFRNGAKIGLDLGSDVNVQSIAQAIGDGARKVGARAAKQMRKAADYAAARAVRRIEARKDRKK
jgi:hypothetical protein